MRNIWIWYVMKMPDYANGRHLLARLLLFACLACYPAHYRFLLWRTGNTPLCVWTDGTEQELNRSSLVNINNRKTNYCDFHIITQQNLQFKQLRYAEQRWADYANASLVGPSFKPPESGHYSGRGSSITATWQLHKIDSKCRFKVGSPYKWWVHQWVFCLTLAL